MFKTIEDIRQANRAHGGHWFDEETMKFFDSRVSLKVAEDGRGGAYFVSSEQFSSISPRLYTVRHADKSGHVGTVGEFQQYGSSRSAWSAIEKLTASEDDREWERENDLYNNYDRIGKPRP